MKHGVCTISIIPVREEPAESSEMVTQLLFGELFEVTEVRKKWVAIRIYTDGYQGWIDRKTWTEIKEKEYQKLLQQPVHYCTELIGLLSRADQTHQPIVYGSQLRNIKQGTFHVVGSEYHYEGAASKTQKASRNELVEHACMFMNAPYLWGGKSPLGIDCSGFVQLLYHVQGIALPRDASQQAEWGQKLSFIEEAEPGDLAFFDNDEGKIIHVGLMLENNHIIHASGAVRIDRIDHQGIHNAELRDYTHQLRLITKLIQ